MAVVTITGSDVTGGTAVGGGGNLTTTGAIPYVTSAGVLGQDATALFWDATNDRLGVGTNAPGKRVGIVGATGDGIDFTNSTAAAGRANFSLTAGIAGYLNEGMALSEVYDATDVFHLTTYQKQLYLGGRSVTSTDTSVTILNGQSKGEILRVNSTSPIVVRSGGNLLIGGTTDGNYKLDVQSSGSTGTLRVFDQGGAGVTKVQIRAGASQTNSDELFTIYNSAGTKLIEGRQDGVFSATILSTKDVTTAAISQDVAYAIGLNLKSSALAAWSSTVNWYDTKDLGLARSASGILEINNGTAGTYRDLRLRTLIASTSIIQGFTTPASASDTGTAGQIAWDTNYIYIATGTNTWKRVAIATW